MAVKTHTGSCHCGAVRWEADIDPDQGSGKCHGWICTKTRNWSVIVQPEAFRLLTDEAAMADYQFGSASAHGLFCRTCGVRPFSRGYIAEIGGHYVCMQLACLDDVTPAALLAGPVRSADGRHSNWTAAPAETAHL